MPSALAKFPVPLKVAQFQFNSPYVGQSARVSFKFAYSAQIKHNYLVLVLELRTPHEKSWLRRTGVKYFYQYHYSREVLFPLSLKCTCNLFPLFHWCSHPGKMSLVLAFWWCNFLQQNIYILGMNELIQDRPTKMCTWIITYIERDGEL